MLVKSKTGKVSIFIILFILAGFVSCGKKTDQTSSTRTVSEAEMVAVSGDDFSETDEDLLTVDYKEFYDKLAPHGEWIEVKGRDIGVDLKKNTAAANEHRTITFSELFGVKDAYADDADFGAFFVWQPAPNLAVSLTTEETVAQPVQYVPYSNGQWVNTSQGWYFRAASEPEEITSHYGRWVNSPSVGWVWVPGRVWAPAWVDWREQDDYIAWEPVPPSTYIINNIIVTPPVVEERYVVVEKKYFAEPEVYKYMYREHKNKIMIKEWRRLDGVMVMNKTVINKGPEVSVIQTYTSTPLEVISINPVVSITQVSYNTNEYKVYRPEFRQVKSKGKVTRIVTSPSAFVTYENAKVKDELNKHSGNDKKNESASKNKGNENQNDNSSKDFRSNRKYIDDGKMKDGGKTKDNGKNKGNGNNKNKQKDNGNKNKGNDNGDKHNQKNDNVKKDKGGNDNSKGNDNSSKNKGNKKFRNDKSNGNSEKNDNAGRNKVGNKRNK
ncbi:MAG: DUF6600 domain-containing protein [Ignavibacteria bacterium]